ncbi:MAG: ABC transporter, partial [Bacteroidota bacterium]
KVPMIAEVMPTKWSYEALMVNQFKKNRFEKSFYDIEKKESQADYMQVYYLPELKSRVNDIIEEIEDEGRIGSTLQKLMLVKNEITYQMEQVPDIHFGYTDKLNPEQFTIEVGYKVLDYIENLRKYYAEIFRQANKIKELKTLYYLDQNPDKFKYLKDNYHNESVTDYVKKTFEKNKILEYDNRLVQQYNPIFQDPRITGPFGFRSHLFAPRKYFMGKYFDTFWFNMSVIWVFTLLLYIFLYYEILKKILELSSKIKIGKQNK